MDNGSFYSVDRLIEFGMGIAMAQQMVRVMNETMRTMYVPGSPSSIPSPAPLTIYAGIDGQTVGPLTESDFSRLVAEKKVSGSTLVWMPGMLGWRAADKVPGILKIVATTPPPLPVM